MASVRKGQLLFRIDPEPYELAVRSAEANLSVALQGADVSVADIAAARAQIASSASILSASRQLGGIVTDLVGKRALAETQGIRARRRHRQVRGRPDARPSGSEEGAGQSRRARTCAIRRSGRRWPRSTRRASTCAIPKSARRPTEPSPTCAWRPANMSARASRC